MHIAIVSHGRFHVADLAQELQRQGLNVTFYSDVPKFRLKEMGIAELNTITLWPATLVRVVELGLRKWGIRLSLNLFQTLLVDLCAWLVLKKCDVIIGMSGICYWSALKAQRRFGAKWIVERSSRHILSQKKILAALSVPGSKVESIPTLIEKRELQSYEKCDYISVPSLHVRESFVAEGVDEKKIWVNPIGINTSQFPFHEVDQGPITLIMVGSWSYQKGAALLLSTWKNVLAREQVRLIHVGSVIDAELPSVAGFSHTPTVSQQELSSVYQKAHVLVLPSYQDGFGVVLSQALASGLLVVASDRTGGPDLKAKVSEPERVEIFKTGDAQDLERALRLQLQRVAAYRNRPMEPSQIKEALSVEGYGRRYSEWLKLSVNPRIKLLF